MPIKVLPIALPSGTYTRLEREARAQERDPVQQARWILKRALDANALPADDDHLTEAGSPATREPV